MKDCDRVIRSSLSLTLTLCQAILPPCCSLAPASITDKRCFTSNPLSLLCTRAAIKGERETQEGKSGFISRSSDRCIGKSRGESERQITRTQSVSGCQARLSEQGIPLSLSREHRRSNHTESKNSSSIKITFRSPRQSHARNSLATSCTPFLSHPVSQAAKHVGSQRVQSESRKRENWQSTFGSKDRGKRERKGSRGALVISVSREERGGLARDARHERQSAAIHVKNR